MSYTANVYNVMIASPADVEDVRKAARESILQWNIPHSRAMQLLLQPLNWEHDSLPLMGKTPQDSLNDQLLIHADLLVIIFGTRLGTPTSNFSSGTIEEIEKHLKADKPALLYFYKKKIFPDIFDRTQFDKLMEFKEKFKTTALYTEVTSLSKFKETFGRHLAMIINKYSHMFHGFSQMDLQLKINDTSSKSLSDEAKQLLYSVTKDSEGMIEINPDNSFIQTNGISFGQVSNVRDFANYRAAIDQLLDINLLEPFGIWGKEFKITSAGYKYADSLFNEVFTIDDFDELEIKIIKLMSHDLRAQLSIKTQPNTNKTKYMAKNILVKEVVNDSETHEKMKSTLESLCQRGFIKWQGTKSWALTYKGFKLADSLK